MKATKIEKPGKNILSKIIASVGNSTAVNRLLAWKSIYSKIAYMAYNPSEFRNFWNDFRKIMSFHGGIVVPAQEICPKSRMSFSKN